jgi:hypothetical protein
MRRAPRTDANHAAVVACLRACGARVESLAAVGGGVPDLLVAVPGTNRLILVEVKDGAKRPSARKLTPDQERWHAEWAGTPVYVVEDIEQAVAVLVKAREATA